MQEIAFSKAIRRLSSEQACFYGPFVGLVCAKVLGAQSAVNITIRASDLVIAGYLSSLCGERGKPPPHVPTPFPFGVSITTNQRYRVAFSFERSRT